MVSLATTMGRTSALVSVLLAGACAADPPVPHPPMGKDVACLESHTGAGGAFRTAMAGCGVDRPDLTGSARLQHLALMSHVPFTIRPRADASLESQAGAVSTGSLLPSAPPERPVLGGAPIL